MRPNRIRTALQVLGGRGTTQDITRLVKAAPENVSAQLAGMANRGQVRRIGWVMVPARRWNHGQVMVPASVWALTEEA